MEGALSRSPMARGLRRLSLAAVLIGAAAVLSGCDGSQGSAATPSPVASETAEPSTPGPAGAGGPSRVSSSIQAVCSAGQDNAEVRVTYSASVANGNLSRVRLMDNGRVSEDSGALAQKEYRRVTTFKVPFGERHAYDVVAEAGATPSATARSTVQCPGRPAPTPGPRV